METKTKPSLTKPDKKQELLEDILAEQQELRDLVEKNVDQLDKLLLHSKKINTWIFSQRIKGYIKILIILIPIVLGIIYIPPLFNDVVGRYNTLLDNIPGFNYPATDADTTPAE